MDRSKWEYKKLTDVCSILYGYPFDSKCFNDNNQGRPLIRIRDVVRGFTETYTTEKCPDEYIISEGDLLIGMDGEFNISAWKSEPALLNQRVCKIKADDKNIIDGFMYYLMKTKLKEIESETAFVTVKHLSAKVLNKVNVQLPSIADQQRIVAELDCLNEMIALKQEQLKEFDKLAQSIFYDMFGDKDFPMYQLKDILSKIGSGATPSGGNQSYKTEGISLIRSLNVHNNLFVYKDLAFIDEQQAKQLNNVTIEEGDVLLNITGASVARCCVVPNDVIPARVNQHVSILRPRKELLDSLYLCHFLISCDEQAKLLSLSRSKAATREALPKNLLEKYSIPLPSLALQQQFAEKIQAIEAQKELVKKSIAETQQLLNSRMDFYFD
jgi:type I restriction enzyme S subunit